MKLVTLNMLKQLCNEFIDVCTCSICYHAVVVRIAFDVRRHPLRLCRSLLQSLCLQYTEVTTRCLWFYICGFSLCVPSLCSAPAQDFRSQSPSLWLPMSVLPFAFLSLSCCLWVKTATFPNFSLSKVLWPTKKSNTCSYSHTVHNITTTDRLCELH